MEDHFSNSQVETLELPSVAMLDLKGLHKDYLTAIMIRAIIFWLLFSIPFITFLFLNDKDYPGYFNYIALAFFLLIIVSRFLLIYLGFHKKKYALRERDILYKAGFIWRSNTVIPFNRIQHAEVNQGPIERLFDLSMLRIFTAGGSASDMAIPGLRPDEAHQIKEFILSKTASDEEE